MTAKTEELEIKLRFANAAEARATVVGAGAAPLKARRLQQDALLDTPDGLLRARRSMLRLRTEPGSSALTFKGPAQPSMMKLREEVETAIGDALILRRVFEELGFHVWFRYEKYREEFTLNGVVIAVDETPVGTFVEIEGSHDGITGAARALGRGPEDYVLDSYRSLHAEECTRRGLPPSDMLF